MDNDLNRYFMKDMQTDNKHMEKYLRDELLN